MKKILFRKARKTDIPSIRALARNVILTHKLYTPSARTHEVKTYFSNAFLLSHIANRAHVYVVAEDGDSIIGFAHGIIEGGVLWNAWVVLDPEYQGKGHFKGLIRALESEYKKRGGWKVWAAILTTNIPSQKAFTKNGYSVVGTLRKHWNKQDFVLVDKVL